MFQHLIRYSIQATGLLLFFFFRDFNLPISSFNAMCLSKWFSCSFVVNSRSCNSEVRCFWVRVGSFCEWSFPKCSVQMFGSWMGMRLASLDLSKLFHNSQKEFLPPQSC